MGRTRIPGLDGLRAIAIAIVLTVHSFGTPKALPITAIPSWVHIGDLPVHLFFVMSGFLITTLLLAEQRKRGAISLTHFYLRRVFRIIPASVTFITAIAVVSGIGVIALRRNDLLHALTYTMNYHPTHERAWTLGHLWSLSIEEQFYLLWPLGVLYLTLRRRLAVTFIAVALPPVLRLAVLIAPSYAEAIGEAFPLTCDGLAIGCLLAQIREDLDSSPRYLRLVQSRAFAIVPLAMVAMVAMPTAALRELVRPTLFDLGVALVIERVTRMPRALAGRVLESRPIVFLGTISYSLYLWQQPFLDHSTDAWWTVFPLNLCLAFAVAMASYVLVERPFQSLGRRIAAESATPTTTHRHRSAQLALKRSPTVRLPAAS